MGELWGTELTVGVFQHFHRLDFASWLLSREGHEEFGLASFVVACGPPSCR